MQILRPNETAAKVGICDRELRNMERQGRFPRRFQLNPPNGRAVERGVRRGLEGFRRDGKRWLAEREAFAQLISNQRL